MNLQAKKNQALNAGTISNWTYQALLGNTVKEKTESVLIRLLELEKIILLKTGLCASELVIGPAMYDLLITLSEFETLPLSEDKIQICGFMIVGFEKWTVYLVSEDWNEETILLSADCSDVLRSDLHSAVLLVKGLVLEDTSIEVTDDMVWKSIKDYASQGQDLAVQYNHWIETAAYYIWLEEGCPNGKDQNHWERAYQMFLERS